MRFILLLSLVFPVAFSSAAVLERLEASVNNQVVLLSDFQKFRQTLGLRSQLDPLFAGTPLAAAGANASNDDIREFLVDEKLILIAFPITDSEVEAEINSIQSNNRMNREQIRAAIRAQGYRYDDYAELIRIGASKRNLIDREIRTRVSISDDDVRNYYVNKYARGKTLPQSYRVLIITNTAREKIESALSAVRGGESFEAAAKKYSDDSSADHGGELGVLTEDQMSPVIRGELKKLKVGETSGVLGNASTQFFVLKLASVQSAEDQQMKKVADEIRGHLATAEYQRQIALWLERQRQVAFIHRAGESSTVGLPQAR